MKKLIIIFIALLYLLFPLSSLANKTKLVDEYGALSDDEKEDLEKQIEDLIAKTGFDIVVYFADSEDEDTTALADDFFDYNNYGLGNDREGIIICINYPQRDYTITTSGEKVKGLFTDAALDEELYANITPYLSDGDSYLAIEAYLEGIEYIYDNPDVYAYPYEEYQSSISPLKLSLLVASCTSLIISIATFFILRGQLKNQHIKRDADQYIYDTHINILRSGEIFLYKTSHTEKIERNDSSGSSSHISSSGRSHGGGGSHHF